MKIMRFLLMMLFAVGIALSFASCGTDGGDESFEPVAVKIGSIGPVDTYELTHTSGLKTYFTVINGVDDTLIADARFNSNGELIITVGNKEINLGRLGDNIGGAKTVIGAAINQNAELVITYSDGTTENLGSVKGEPGKDGAAPTIEISADGYWIINGVKTEYKAIGEDGADGEDGQDGAPGQNGAPGENGETPTIDISADGYWVINGVKTEFKAVASEGTPSVDENPQQLDFYPTDNGTYYVGIGKARYLSHIVIPATYRGAPVVGIATEGFRECTELKSIIIPDSITSIGRYAFDGCANLKTIYYIGTKAEWNSIQKGNGWINSPTYTTVCTDGGIDLQKLGKDEWEAAFVFDNVTMSVTENAYYGTMLYQSVDFEIYFIDGGEGFDKDGLPQGSIQDYIAYFAFKSSFDKFTYNSDTDEYTCSYITVDGIIYENVVIKFTEDNKLKSVAFDSDSSYLTYKITADFTNYTSTEKPERAPFEPVGDEFCSYFNTRELEGRNLAYITIKVKDYGDIKLVLDATTAPVTVNHMLKLISEGFYDGLSFHRVINEFMIQGGDPEADGTGDYKNEAGEKVTIKGEFSSNGHENDILHLRGVISMARGNDNDSASCQFFICNADSDWLDGKYAAFGYVIDGMSVVDHITYDTMIYGDSNGTIEDKTKQAVIESITIDELVGFEIDS